MKRDPVAEDLLNVIKREWSFEPRKGKRILTEEDITYYIGDIQSRVLRVFREEEQQKKEEKQTLIFNKIKRCRKRIPDTKEVIRFFRSLGGECVTAYSNPITKKKDRVQRVKFYCVKGGISQIGFLVQCLQRRYPRAEIDFNSGLEPTFPGKSIWLYF